MASSGGTKELMEIISTGISIHEEAQLDEDLSCLRASLLKAHNVIDRGEWGRFKNKDLEALLSHLKDTTYDAGDLLRESDDQVLRQQMEDTGRSWAGQLLSSSLNFAKTLIRGSKKRIKEVQDKINKAVADLEGELNSVDLNFGTVQQMPLTDAVISVPQVFGRDEERDIVIEKMGVMIGRDNERDLVIEKLGVPLTPVAAARAKGKRAAVGTATKSASAPKRLKGESSKAGPRLSEAKCIGNVSVLPIFGIGGVGKTTLVQYIYNDSRVEAHFDKRIWVCVSDLFDKKRIIEEIFKSITTKDPSQHSSNDLHEQLKRKLQSQKFLLVLDDIWHIANRKWEEINALLRHGLEGSMILVTTRFQNVADLVTTNNCKPIKLEGLDEDIFWKFFMDCAFGQKCPESYPELHAIGQSIASRLCRSPLAAKTLGRLLNMELTVQHWDNIEKSELWELPHQENEILPALQLSYLYLPRELRRCFAFCSMFPKDYSFERDEIVDIWVAENLVELAPGARARPEDMGIRYLDDLRSRFLFQTDPKYPDQSRYVMHDLIHDMALSVSLDECFLLQHFSSQNRVRMHAVRHMSVEVNDESLKSGIRGIQYLNKLHSLRFGIKLEVEITWFNQLSNILFLSLKGCKLVKLPESIGELHSLRYLDISRSRVQVLPEKFWCLYGLQVVDASRSSLKVISPDITKLINLRHLALPSGCSPKLSDISGFGNLSRIRNLKHFRVATGNRRKIGELKGMNQLSGTLTIRSVFNVKSKEEASEARLVDKQYLQALVLLWRENFTHRMVSSENGVLEGLCPPPRIQRLKIENFAGDNFSPSWFKPETLPTLRSLEISCCCSMKLLSIPSFRFLEELMLSNISTEALIISESLPTLRTLDLSGWSSLRSVSIPSLPTLRTLHLKGCRSLTSLSIPSLPSLEVIKFTWVGIEALTISYGSLPTLRTLDLWDCYSLRSLSIPSLPSLEELTLISVNIEALTMQHESSSISSSNIGIACLRGLTSICLSNCGRLRNVDQCLSPEYLPYIRSIEITNCESLESIPVHSFGGFDHLQDLKIDCCEKLVCEQGMVLPPSLQRLYIRDCGNLMLRNISTEVLTISESLPTLRTLDLLGCSSLRSVSIPSLPTLRTLHLQGCSSLRTLSIPSLPSLEVITLISVNIEALTMQHESSSITSSNIGIACLGGLTSMCLHKCCLLRNLDQFLTPEYMPCIKSIEITLCSRLESIPVHTFGEFDHLQDLKIAYCEKLVCEQEMVLPPSLRRLYISNCGFFDKSFPACLQKNLTSLIVLRLDYCGNMESIPIATRLHVKYLHLFSCSKLSSIGGSHALSSMQFVYINHCPKLQEVEQPFTIDLLTKEDKKERDEFFRFD